MTVVGVLQDGWIMASRDSISQNGILCEVRLGVCAAMIHVACPLCGQVYHADPAHLGKSIRCTKCGSVLPILGSEGTLARKPPQVNEIRQPPSRVEPRAKEPTPRRTSFRVGAVVVAVAAVGLAIFWRHSNTHGDTGPVTTPHTSETQTSAGGFQVLSEEPPATGSEGLPCDEQAPTTEPSIPNGTRILPDAGTTGYGVLEVQNGTSEDAVLSLYDSAADETVRDVYVQARHSVRMKGIPAGTYQLAYTAGLDWDGREAFRCNPDYAQFERDFVYAEEKNHEGVQYHSITVTLQPVIGGNVRTKKISKEEFLKGHHRTASLTTR
jgi:phage FluMu protein Com